MEHTNDDKSTLLLETIRKELVAIIDEEGSKNVLKGSSNNCQELKYSQRLSSPPTTQYNGAGDDCLQSGTENISRRECWTTLRNGDDTTSSSSSKRSSTFLDSHNTVTIDEDLQNMRSNLKESYELFQSVGDRFENINFGCLKSRIKDLHLNERSSESIKAIVNDLKKSFDEKCVENRLNDLTKEVATKFRNHPGEFGDIPELSEFFRSCTQLQRGLEKLRKQRYEVQDLTKRITRVTEASYDRVNEIQQKMLIERNELCTETIEDTD